MIEKICNKYVDFSKIVSMELISTPSEHEPEFCYIKCDVQLLEKPLTISLDDSFQTKEENNKIKEEFNKALQLWKNINKNENNIKQ